MLMDEADGAMLQFESILQTGARGPLAAIAYVNMANIQRSLNRSGPARELLYKSIDSTNDLDLQAHAYWLLGDIELEEGNFDAAIIAAARGARIGHLDSVKEKSSLTLSKAYLLSNQPISANQALYDARSSFYDDDAIHMAGLIGAYSRFVASRSDLYRQHESQRLLTELVVVNSNDHFDIVDDYLAAKGFQMLGFEQDCIRILERALTKARNDYWRRRLAFELAVIQHEYGDSTNALKVLDLINMGQQDELAILGSLERAKIHLDLAQYEECIDACRTLFGQTLNADQKKTILEIMGQAYRKLNLHYSAALCYAGVLPHDEIR
jgi:tetratricopeptide (TPR) repeat protein